VDNNKEGELELDLDFGVLDKINEAGKAVAKNAKNVLKVGAAVVFMGLATVGAIAAESSDMANLPDIPSANLDLEEFDRWIQQFDRDFLTAIDAGRLNEKFEHVHFDGWGMGWRRIGDTSGRGIITPVTNQYELTNKFMNLAVPLEQDEPEL